MRKASNNNALKYSAKFKDSIYSFLVREVGSIYQYGGSYSKPTVLDCMMKNFKKNFSGDYGVKMTSGKICTLCKSEWPTFRVGWPAEGTLDLPTVRAVY